MHKDFAEWYRLGGIEPNGDWLAKRWAAISDYEPGEKDILFLTRLFYGMATSAESVASFRSIFQSADPAFKMRGNEHELAVLAGAELIDVMERSADFSDLAALAIVCTAASNLRPPPCVRDIPEIAARYLGDRTANRFSIERNKYGVEANESLYDALAAQPAPSPDLAKALHRQERDLALVREESNILWWLFSEHSRDGNPWSAYPSAAVPLMAGKELADLTQLIPGPIAARAFLERVIRYGKGKTSAAVGVTDAINEVALAWRQGLANEYNVSALGALSPLMFGIQLSVSSPDDNAWVPPFVQATGIPSKAKLTPSLLAHQAFLEIMLHRVWRRGSA